ncbi:MAG TPA: hypothetical protein VFK80_02450, partial [Limnochordia bacterium]|nr:hypothetical protein [Limnochordia bacterium]
MSSKVPLLVQGETLLRLPVIDSGGRRVSRIRDLAFDPYGGPVISLHLERAHERFWLAARHFRALGPDGAVL